MHLGKWIQRRVFPDLRLIKKESFKFFEDEVVSILTNKIFFTIFESSVMTNCHHDLLLGSPSNHEEDDARMLFHAKDVRNSVIIKVSIPSEDTGIVFGMFSKLNLNELLLLFGTWKPSAI